MSLPHPVGLEVLGLGVANIDTKYCSLLTKQIWRFSSIDDSPQHNAVSRKMGV